MASVTVTVYTVHGELLLGPEELPHNELQCLRQSLLQGRRRERVQLMNGSKLLDEAETLTGDVLEFTAIFVERVSADERVACLESILQSEFDSYCFQRFSEEARADPEIVLKSIERARSLRKRKSHEKHVLRCFQSAGDSCRRDRDLLLNVIETDARCLKFAVDSLRDDRQFVIEAIARSTPSQAHVCLQYAGSAIRNDREIVLTAIAKSNCHHVYDCFQLAGDSCRDDREIVLEVIAKSRSSRILQHAGEVCRNDLEIVLAENAMRVANASIEHGGDLFGRRNSRNMLTRRALHFIQDLKDRGYTLPSLARAGCPLIDLKKAGFDIPDKALTIAAELCALKQRYKSHGVTSRQVNAFPDVFALVQQLRKNRFGQKNQRMAENG